MWRKIALVWRELDVHGADLGILHAICAVFFSPIQMLLKYSREHGRVRHHSNPAFGSRTQKSQKLSDLSTKGFSAMKQTGPGQLWNRPGPVMSAVVSQNNPSAHQQARASYGKTRNGRCGF